MGSEIEKMLRRVVDSEFGEGSSVEFSADPKREYEFRARISNASGRKVALSASQNWFEATILGLDSRPNVTPSALFYDYDGDYSESWKEELLRTLAGVLRAYLDGEGRVERRRILLCRSKPRYLVVIDGKLWRLGPGSSTGWHPPELG